MDFCITRSENRRTCHWPEGNPFDKKGWEWWGQVAWRGPASQELRGTARSQGWALTWGDLAMQGWRSGLKMVIKVSHSPVSSQQVHSNEANVRWRWGISLCSRLMVREVPEWALTHLQWQDPQHEGSFPRKERGIPVLRLSCTSPSMYQLSTLSAIQPWEHADKTPARGKKALGVLLYH